MGSIALLRQTYCDAEWYDQFDPPCERNLSLEAFNAAADLPHFFDAGDWRDVLRADLVGDEFEVQYAFLGGGDTTGGSMRWLRQGRVDCPAQFPSAIDVSDPYLARLVSLEEMKHWEWAPYNAGKVAEAGIPMALTMHGVSQGQGLRGQPAQGRRPRLSAARGPGRPDHGARFDDWGRDRVGQLAPGLEGLHHRRRPFFENGTALRATVVQGVRHDVDTEPEADVAGRYSLNLDGRDLVLELKTGDKDPVAAGGLWAPRKRPSTRWPARPR